MIYFIFPLVSIALRRLACAFRRPTKTGSCQIREHGADQQALTARQWAEILHRLAERAAESELHTAPQ